MNSEEKRTLNSKEKKAFYLDALTEQAKRNFISRRDFMKASMALGLTATSALLLFQACGGDDANGGPGGYHGSGGYRGSGRLPRLRRLPLYHRRALLPQRSTPVPSII